MLNHFSSSRPVSADKLPSPASPTPSEAPSSPQHSSPLPWPIPPPRASRWCRATSWDLLGCTTSLVLSGSQAPATLSCAPTPPPRPRPRPPRRLPRPRSRRQPRQRLRSRRQPRQRLRSRRQPRRLPRGGLVRAPSPSTTRRTAGGSTGRTTVSGCSNHLDRLHTLRRTERPIGRGWIDRRGGPGRLGPHLRTGER